MNDVVFREAGPADAMALHAATVQILRETGALKSTIFDRTLAEWQHPREGERSSFVVIAELGGELVGYYHVLLLPMRYLGRPARGAMVHDVATMAPHRGHGLFRRMGAFALERMRARGIDLVYTFPNARSLPSFIRDHGYTVAASVPVRVAALDPRAMLRRRVGPIGAPLAVPLRSASALLAREVRGGSVTIEHLDGLEQAASIARDFAGTERIAAERTAGFLRWRFLEKPTREYTVWGLRRERALRAYVVTREAEFFSSRCLLLMDLGCSGGEGRSLRSLVGARLAAARGDGVELAVMMGLHPSFAGLARIGFVRVPERVNPRAFPLVVRPIAPDIGPELVDASRWFITLADWDVL
jgi:GNAT superfamily N-acetyltransferase